MKETMAKEIWEHSRSDDDARVGPRLERDPPLSFTSSANSYTNRQRKRDLRLWQATTALATNRQGGWLLRQLKGKSRTAAELVIDEVLMSIDGHRQTGSSLQDRANALLGTRRHGARTKLLVSRDATQAPLAATENAVRGALPSITKGCAILRDAKLNEGSNVDFRDCCGHNDVIKALV